MPFQPGQGPIDISPVSDALDAIAESIRPADPLQELRRWWAAADPDQRRAFLSEVLNEGDDTRIER
ncbi:MAG: hypothetical protein IID40_10295 [Planctomycetes bacterium]|nr:hypothetical protein [Planctomycetota bacterium]